MLLHLRVLRIITHRSTVDEVRLHVKHQGEVHFAFVFLFADQTFLFKPFEVKNQNFGSSINTHFFVCQFVLLTAWTVPLISALKLLGLTHSLETARNIDWAVITLFADLDFLRDILKIFEFVETKMVRCSFRKTYI